MLDDFTRKQIRSIATNDPACIKALVNTVQDSINSFDCIVNNAITKEAHACVSRPESYAVQILKKDFCTTYADHELEQKKVISGLIRQKFVNTAINIPNKTTKSIIEWYLMVPSDTFLKYVEWYKENGYSF